MQEKIQKTKVMTVPVVKRVAIPDTLASIPHGKTARFTIKDMKLTSLRAMVSLINKRAGRKEYEVIPYENGAFFDVIRH